MFLLFYNVAYILDKWWGISDFCLLNKKLFERDVLVFEVLIINSVSGTKPIGRVFNKVVGLVKNVNDAIDPSTKKMIGTAIITFAGAVISKLIEQNRDK